MTQIFVRHAAYDPDGQVSITFDFAVCPEGPIAHHRVILGRGKAEFLVVPGGLQTLPDSVAIDDDGLEILQNGERFGLRKGHTGVTPLLKELLLPQLNDPERQLEFAIVDFIAPQLITQLSQALWPTKSLEEGLKLAAIAAPRFGSTMSSVRALLRRYVTQELQAVGFPNVDEALGPRMNYAVEIFRARPAAGPVRYLTVHPFMSPDQIKKAVMELRRIQLVT